MHVKPRRILVIEDNLDGAQAMKDLLELSGHEVVLAHDGIDGVAQAREHHPEVILCDIGLPGMDGYQVAREIRADASIGEPMLVALTGYALPEDLKRAFEAGFDLHLSKPPELSVLEDVLAEGHHGSRG
jgi:two-component system CheB/CheR fusion protein